MVIVKIGIVLLSFALAFWLWMLPQLDFKILRIILTGMLLMTAVIAGCDILPELTK
jgi:hypothetical protein